MYTFIPPASPAPGERSGHDISLALDIDAGVAIEKIRSTSHEIDVDHISSSRARVALGRHDSVPNRDFVLRYKVAGERLKGELEEARWFTRDELLSGTRQLPFHISIARRLVDHWINLGDPA